MFVARREPEPCLPRPTHTQLEAVLQAALYLLGAERDRMLTIEVGRTWLGLSLPAKSTKTADYLHEHDLEDIAEPYALEWDEATDGPLPNSTSEACITRLAPSRDTRRGFLFGRTLCRKPLRLAARELLPAAHGRSIRGCIGSMRNACRPVISALMSVEPLPPKRSSTFSQGDELDRPPQFALSLLGRSWSCSAG